MKTSRRGTIKSQARIYLALLTMFAVVACGTTGNNNLFSSTWLSALPVLVLIVFAVLAISGLAIVVSFWLKIRRINPTSQS